MICLRHTGGQASRSHLLPCYPQTAPDKHAIRRRDQRGEARRPSSSTSPACAQQRHHRLSTAKSGAGFSCPDLGPHCAVHRIMIHESKCVVHITAVMARAWEAVEAVEVMVEDTKTKE